MVGEFGLGKFMMVVVIFGLFLVGGWIIVGCVVFDGCDIIGVDVKWLWLIRGWEIGYVF